MLKYMSLKLHNKRNIENDSVPVYEPLFCDEKGKKYFIDKGSMIIDIKKYLEINNLTNDSKLIALVIKENETYGFVRIEVRGILLSNFIESLASSTRGTALNDRDFNFIYNHYCVNKNKNIFDKDIYNVNMGNIVDVRLKMKAKFLMYILINFSKKIVKRT